MREVIAEANRCPSGNKLFSLSRAHLTVLNGAFGEVIAFCHDLTSSSQNAIYILYRKSKNLPFGLGPWAWVLGPVCCAAPARLPFAPPSTLFGVAYGSWGYESHACVSASCYSGQSVIPARKTAVQATELTTAVICIKVTRVENGPAIIEWQLAVATDLHDHRPIEVTNSHIHALEFTGLSNAI